jgi:hypothetical protein
MQRDLFPLTEMIDAEQAQRLVDAIAVSQVKPDRQCRDALLWARTAAGGSATVGVLLLCPEKLALM